MSESRALRRLIRKITVETLWIYVAKVLLGSSPMKAYEIKKRLHGVFGIRVPAITVYTVVYRMCREGLLEPVKNDGEVLYRLTEKGVSEFSRALQVLESTVVKLKG